jgi:hypothetical protein
VIQPIGADILVFFELGGREAVCRVPPATAPQPGEHFDTARRQLSDPVTEPAIYPTVGPTALLVAARL